MVIDKIIGKTVSNVEQFANYIKIIFADESVLELEVEVIIPTLNFYGIAVKLNGESDED